MAKTAKKKTETTTEFVEAQDAATQGKVGSEQAATSINLQDLNTLAQIVDLATSRGAFRAGEMTQVGAVYDKLTGFLRQVAAAQAEAEETKEEE